MCGFSLVWLMGGREVRGGRREGEGEERERKREEEDGGEAGRRNGDYGWFGEDEKGGGWGWERRSG